MEYSEFWFLASGAGFLFLFSFVLPFACFMSKNHSFTEKIFLSIMIFFLVIGIGFLYIMFLKLIIPGKILGNWRCNYILNALIQLGFIVLIAKSKSSSKNKYKEYKPETSKNIINLNNVITIIVATIGVVSGILGIIDAIANKGKNILLAAHNIFELIFQ